MATETFTITAHGFRKLGSQEQADVLNGLSPTDRGLLRCAIRMDVLKVARDKLQAKILRSPKRNPSVKLWKKRVAEYDESLKNLSLYRQEAPPTGNPVGVEISPQTAFKGQRKG